MIGRNGIIKLLPFLFSLVILLALELSARAVVHVLDLELEIVVIHPNIGQAELKKQIYVNDRYLLWRMKPDLEGQFASPAYVPPGREPSSFRVNTNSRGFRGEEFERSKQPGTTRVVCLGNSSTFGWGVPPDSCYPRLLEDLLRHASPRNYEVINAGTPGYSSLQGLILLEREILALEPDVITLAFGANDCLRTAQSDLEILEERSGTIGAAQEFFSHFTLYRIFRYFIVSMKVKKESGEDTPHPVTRRVSPAQYKNAMRRSIEKALAAGSRVILIEIFPISEEWRPYEKTLHELAGDYGLGALDTGDLFEKTLTGVDDTDEEVRDHVAAALEHYGPETTERFPDRAVRLDRVHPTALGHFLTARALSSMIIDDPSTGDD